MPVQESPPSEGSPSDLHNDDPVRARARGDAPAERQCMTCGTTFFSEGWHNRLCRRCARRSAPPGSSAAHRGTSG